MTEDLDNALNSKPEGQAVLNQWWWMGVVFKQDGTYNGAQGELTGDFSEQELITYLTSTERE